MTSLDGLRADLLALNAAANRHGADHELSAVCSRLHTGLPGLLGRVEAAEAERDALRTALVVWQERYGRCPLCFRLSQWGHESDCAALAAAPSGPAAGGDT